MFQALQIGSNNPIIWIIVKNNWTKPFIETSFPINVSQCENECFASAVFMIIQTKFDSLSSNCPAREDFDLVVAAP